MDLKYLMKVADDAKVEDLKVTVSVGEAFTDAVRKVVIMGINSMILRQPLS